MRFPLFSINFQSALSGCWKHSWYYRISNDSFSFRNNQKRPKQSNWCWKTNFTPHIWTASSEFGTYRLCEQRRFRRACAVSPERSLLAHTSSESRKTFWQRARSLAQLNGWACAAETCHDGMLEDTNSLNGAHMMVCRVGVKFWIIKFKWHCLLSEI